MLKSRFEGENYRLSRPIYPASLFDSIRSLVHSLVGGERLQVLDLGAGTGYASEAFSRVYSESALTLVEPDQSMINEAKSILKDAQFVNTRAEVLPLVDQSIDLVLIGSAWHWMDYEKTKSEILRVLRPRGGIFVFEYQFPKAQDCLELNEWVRRQFNLCWKAPLQVPRGSLYEITDCFRSDFSLAQVVAPTLSEVREYSVSEFAAMIYSQSRYLHFEETLSNEDREKNRLKIETELLAFWKGAQVKGFLYAYGGYAFQKRP